MPAALTITTFQMMSMPQGSTLYMKRADGTVSRYVKLPGIDYRDLATGRRGNDLGSYVKLQVIAPDQDADNAARCTAFEDHLASVGISDPNLADETLEHAADLASEVIYPRPDPVFA